MPADLAFDNLRGGLADNSISWTGDTIMCVLFLADAWAPDAGDQFVQDAIDAGAIEAATSGDRQVLTTTAINPDGTLHRAFLTADPIAYTGVANGVMYDSLVVYKFVTDDTDSLILGLFSILGGVGDGTDVDLTPDTNGYFEV